MLHQLRKGFAIAPVLGLALFATALVPRMRGLAPVTKTEVRQAHAPNAVHAVPMVAGGELSIVHYVHRAVSVRGILADQAFRLFAALVFLAVYSVGVRSSNRMVRGGMAAFALLGAAGCLSDFISYATIGGVVDWIGVNGHSAFAPSDLCWALAPLGMFLAATLGLMTLALRRGGRIPTPSWSFELPAVEIAPSAVCLD